MLFVITQRNILGEESMLCNALFATSINLRYKRVFCVGTKAITTLNPGTSEVTNQVCYQIILLRL